ncbi:putative uncharacterized protein DDB_G0290521 [Cardiocondyla obscurior]|uniref:putative uncharacterized protein DDB_G0290521 n=1 Tax=Cardiocondyla obscurior TaxID=286306 RepID=UPI0039657FDE
MLPVNGDYQNLSLSDGLSVKSRNLRSIKKSRARRNRKIRELRELVQSFFVQFLFAAAPREVTPEPQKTRSERSWSPPPTVPPNSPINSEDLESEENTPPRTPSPSRLRSTSSSEPEPELFRPTSPSYTPDVSLNFSRPSPGVASRACSSPIQSPTPYPGEPEEVDSFAEDETISWHEPDSPEQSPFPAPSVEFLEEQEEPREVVDPLLELLRRTCTPWTDPVPERAYTIGPDSFDPEEIRREARRATPDHNILIYYPGVEHPFLAPIRLIDKVFPRSTARITEIIEIDLE